MTCLVKSISGTCSCIVDRYQKVVRTMQSAVRKYLLDNLSENHTNKMPVLVGIIFYAIKADLPFSPML